PKPLKSPSLTGYPRCDEEVRAIADEVWGNIDGVNVKERSFGRGKVIWGQPLQDVLNKLDIPPDFEPLRTPDGARLAYIHRKIGSADVYFVSNQRYRPERVTCTFRVSGRIPELWHPDTGEIETAPVFEEKNGRTSVLLNFDPAGSVFVVFRRPSRGHTHLTSLSRIEDEAARRAPRIEIRRAFYEPADGRPGGADVTAKVAEMVAAGEYSIPASNNVFGDPTPNIVKRLRVEYILNGRPMQKIAAENETLELAVVNREEFGPPSYKAVVTNGKTELIPWQTGTYAFKTAGGRTGRIAISRPPSTLQIAGPWNLRFPAGWGAPERVRLDRLISWTEHPNPGVRYFSGTAEYT
ncbi:MAG: glycosyl hydrolase, partial [Armatimonadota bacterium]